MATAETAQLQVLLELKDQLSGGLAKAQGQLAALDKAASTSTVSTAKTSGALRSVEQAAANMGGALSHAKSQIGGLIAGPLGFLGLTAGAFTLGSALSEGIKKAETFGETVDRMSSITGLSVQTTSELASALSYFGVQADEAIRITGMAEKNVGILTASQKAETAFVSAYGFALRDSSGKVKDFNTLLLTSADYFNNKAIPAQTKAAALAKIYGRNWQSLVEVFEQGAPKIKAAEDQAARLGLTVTPANMKDLLALRDATREWGQALGGLELQIGLALVPELTKLSEAATKFVSNNRQNIVDFFKSGAKFAEDFAAAAAPVVGFFGSLAGAWNKLPSELKTLLIGGFVANKASKFLFGSSLLDIFKGGGNLLGGLAGRGGTPANPVFVSDVTGGIGSKLPLPEVAAGVGAAGIATTVGLMAAAAVVSAKSSADLVGNTTLYQRQSDTLPGAGTRGQVYLLTNPSASVLGGRDYYHGQSGMFSTAAGDTYSERAASRLQSAGATLARSGSNLASAAAALIHAAGLWKDAHKIFEGAGFKFSGAFLRSEVAKGGKLGANFGTVADAATIALVNNLVLKEGKAKDAADVKSARQMISTLQAALTSAQRSGNTTLAHQLAADISKLKTQVNVTVNANTSVSVSDLAKKTVVHSRWSLVKGVVQRNAPAIG